MERPGAHKPTLPPAIEPADIEWRSGKPWSRQFGDVYASQGDGFEKNCDLLLEHNRLTERFKALGRREPFVVAESGFGAGLNFLATWQAWRVANPAPHASLHFVSVEPFPLSSKDLELTLNQWPELAELAQELLHHYPPLVQGAHRLVLDRGRVRLTLVFGETLKTFGDLEFIADAWFLDGMAGPVNTDCSEPAMVRQIRRHSRHGTTFATCSASQQHLYALRKAGFVTASGCGRKTEILTGFLDLPGPFSVPGEPEQTAPFPAHSTATSEDPDKAPSSTDVAVVGAGIAGCLLARNLAERGYNVVLAEQGENPAVGASGNSQGALYVKLPVEFNDQARLALSSLLFAQSYYPVYTPAHYHQTGLLMMAASGREADRQNRFLTRNRYPQAIFRAVSPAQACELTGVPCPAGGLWFPASGWLAPVSVCRQLLDHPLIRLECHYKVSRLLPCNNRWRLSAEGRQDITASHIVLAAGHESAALDTLVGHCRTGRYRFKPIRGQISSFPVRYLGARPRAVITGERYLNPPLDDQVVTGATFDLHDDTPDELWTSHQENLAGLSEMLPGLVAKQPTASEVTGRVSFRCTTHDYQPVAGPLTTSAGKPIDGVWLLTGFGSKGLTWGPLLAEFLADRISGQPQALPASLARRVSPERCLRKADQDLSPAHSGR